MGNAGRYGEGDLQWLTCGKGVCHAEMFPLINNNKPNYCKLEMLEVLRYMHI